VPCKHGERTRTANYDRRWFWDLFAERGWRLIVETHRQTQLLPEHTRYHNHRVR
jgi:hypothetical protein